MIRRLLIALAVLAGLAGTASALTGPYYFPSNKPRSKRVAVIWPARTLTLNQTALGQVRVSYEFNVMPIVDELERQGCDVHTYRSDWFEDWNASGDESTRRDRRNLWIDIGSYYSLVLVMYPHNPNAAQARYVCADSTNGNLVVVTSGEASSSAADTTIRGHVDWSAQHNMVGTQTNFRLITYTASHDTIWLNRVSVGKRIFVLPSGIDSVVRVFHMQSGFGATTTNYAGAAGSAESLWVDLPAYGDSVSRAALPRADSTAGSKTQLLGPMWRVRFHNNVSISPAVVNGTANNSLGSSAPRDVYWFKGMTCGNSANIAFTYNQFLWALACRFTTASPIRISYEADDAFDKFADNTAARSGGTNASADSMIARFDSYGIRWNSLIANPDHAVSYIRGTDPIYESAWTASTGTNYVGKRTLGWVFHAHDTTAWLRNANVTRGGVAIGAGNDIRTLSGTLVGRFAGYTGGNLTNTTQGGATVEYVTDRVASRWNPVGTIADSTQVGTIYPSRNRNAFRAGIIQRLAYSDSLRRAVCPSCYLPPYLAFTNDEILPVNYIGTRPSRPAGLAAWTMYGTSGQPDSLLCPIDSLLWAFDSMLVDRGTHNRAPIYLRAQFGDIRSQWIGFDRDSFPATTPFLFPGERWATQVKGRTVVAQSVGTITIGAVSKSSDGYYTSSTLKVSQILGLTNGVKHSSISNAFNNESADNDYDKVYSAAGAQRYNGSRLSVHNIYNHPLSGGFPLNGAGSYDNDVFVLLIAQQLRALNEAVAGRPCWRSVKAWESQGVDK